MQPDGVCDLVSKAGGTESAFLLKGGCFSAATGLCTFPSWSCTSLPLLATVACLLACLLASLLACLQLATPTATVTAIATAAAATPTANASATAVSYSTVS